VRNLSVVESVAWRFAAAVCIGAAVDECKSVHSHWTNDNFISKKDASCSACVR